MTLGNRRGDRSHAPSISIATPASYNGPRAGSWRGSFGACFYALMVSVNQDLGRGALSRNSKTLRDVKGVITRRRAEADILLSEHIVNSPFKSIQ